MKQTYQKPATDILRVEAQPMLTDSLNVTQETITDKNDILSRRGNSVWDDEDNY